MPSKNPMKFFRSLDIGKMCGVFGIEKPKVIIFTIGTYVSLPFISSRVPRHPFQTRFVGDGHFNVMHILYTVCLPKVLNSVVRWVSINMVNFVDRPLSVRDCPSNSVRPQQNIINSSNDISSPIPTCYNCARSALTPLNPPRKLSGAWIIRKKLFEPVYVWVSHVAMMATFKGGVNTRYRYQADGRY